MPTPPDLSAFRTPAATGRPPRGLRLGLAAALAVVWFAVLGLGGPVFGRIGDVSSNDQATFLPKRVRGGTHQPAARTSQ